MKLVDQMEDVIWYGISSNAHLYVGEVTPIVESTPYVLTRPILRYEGRKGSHKRAVFSRLEMLGYATVSNIFKIAFRKKHCDTRE